ncbi:hypothetical protein ACFWXA_34645 [Streptomyces atroolivaceus]|uniref:hypothetical protein n=1 Tax=Streptomyces atroolivaceus TaxID=66869 RepID=UPI0036587175
MQWKNWLVRLASGNREARHLAGEIMERAASHHGSDELLTESADVIAKFGALLDRHLQSRPSDYLVTFRALLAVWEQYHWANVLGDFADDFYDLQCPHCGVEVTVAIGGYGHYSAMRVWNLGDVDRRDLRPKGRIRGPSATRVLTGRGADSRELEERVSRGGGSTMTGRYEAVQVPPPHRVPRPGWR